MCFRTLAGYSDSKKVNIINFEGAGVLCIIVLTQRNCSFSSLVQDQAHAPDIHEQPWSIPLQITTEPLEFKNLPTCSIRSGYGIILATMPPPAIGAGDSTLAA